MPTETHSPRCRNAKSSSALTPLARVAVAILSPSSVSFWMAAGSTR